MCNLLERDVKMFQKTNELRLASPSQKYYLFLIMHYWMERGFTWSAPAVGYIVHTHNSHLKQKTSFSIITISMHLMSFLLRVDQGSSTF